MSSTLQHMSSRELSSSSSVPNSNSFPMQHSSGVNDLSSYRPFKPTLVNWQDEASIIKVFADQGLAVQEPSKAQLFMTCSELEQGKITTEEFFDIAKDLCGLMSVDRLGILMAINNVAKQIKDRTETENMSLRYLSGLETAAGLSQESIRLVTAVKELVETTSDNEEVVRLQASFTAIRAFLQEDVAPFLEELNNKPSGSVPVLKIREKRAEVKAKLEEQRKNVEVHLQKAKAGLSRMSQGDFCTQTNHLPRYAAACALEILLRAYYTNLGMFDSEDFMVKNDLKYLKTTAFSRCHGEQGICSLFSRYSELRFKLLSTKFEKGGKGDLSFYVHDAGVAGDEMLPKQELKGIAKDLVAAPIEPSTKHEDPRKAEQYYQGVQASFQQIFFEVKHHVTEDGAFVYFYNSPVHGTDKATPAGLLLYKHTQQLMRRQLTKVWNDRFQRNIETMQKVLEVAFKSREPTIMGLLPEMAQPVKSLPKTTPVKNFVSVDWAEKMLLVEAPGATPGAKTKQSGFVLCRAFGGIIPGEIQLDTKRISIACEGKRCYPKNDYCEVIVDNTGFDWVEASNGKIPDTAVAMGQDTQSQPLYIACTHDVHGSQSGTYAGKIGKGMKGCQYIFNSKVVEHSPYEVLCFSAAVKTVPVDITPLALE